MKKELKPYLAMMVLLWCMLGGIVAFNIDNYVLLSIGLSTAILIIGMGVIKERIIERIEKYIDNHVKED